MEQHITGHNNNKLSITYKISKQLAAPIEKSSSNVLRTLEVTKKVNEPLQSVSGS